MGVQLRNIHKSFGNPPTHVLRGISLDIEDGEFVTVTGRSGSGKSTLLYIISSLDNPSSGEVLVDGINVHDLSEADLHAFRNLKMGFVFQFHHLLPELTALENVLMPAIKRGITNEHRQNAEVLFSEFGMSEKLHRFPAQLSGGEQQRVAIARALIMQPKYLFADEPTGNLDSVNGFAVMNLLQKINKERKMCVVYVTHDLEFSKMAHRQIHLIDGSVAKA